MIESPHARFLLDATVEPGFIDYNGHMNDACYALVFSRALDVMLEQIGLGDEGRRAHRRTVYTLSLVIHYLKEARLGMALRIEGRLLEHDAKRLRVYAFMRNGETGDPLAETEQTLLCVDATGETARAAPFPLPVAAAIAAFAAESAGAPFPERAGRGASLRRPA